jgi:hypothetical protein
MSKPFRSPFGIGPFGVRDRDSWTKAQLFRGFEVADCGVKTGEILLPASAKGTSYQHHPPQPPW